MKAVERLLILAERCPVCRAAAKEPCTTPDDTDPAGRRTVAWLHLSREEAAAVEQTQAYFGMVR